ncbi:MAG: hypothetical protein A2940_00155 [Candidatus Wildermuthbacteria bacterium RIFCSPLOWO2_01_FULL_48_29]|uniref:Uncharacterized protein n=2 Tax=Candidatus Wildermuthiibacteriota TaxID=1817923 RepID=A0A1G2RM32_9BACT|nr:MAG: hypothetical protein A2843_01605 [Candidatus Wildermuthbacteria bacterium RIFCSPHIGHO2_01_FULL_48_27b]OHA73925.1 MAG: hypothetical protein A2940_00155 [Candidatus Wildermuthbacteria bacterium RIFCSPLOWO2_01_FULL_48_29]
MADEAVAEFDQEEEEDVETPPESDAGVSPFDPDFLIFALPLAFILDILSYLFMGLDLGIIAAGVNIVLGGILIAWMVHRGKRMDEAKEMYRQGVETARMGRAGIEPRRQITQQKITSAVGKTASKRLLKRALFFYAAESIPIVNFIPFWLAGVILMLREK